MPTLGRRLIAGRAAPFTEAAADPAPGGDAALIAHAQPGSPPVHAGRGAGTPVPRIERPAPAPRRSRLEGEVRRGRRRGCGRSDGGRGFAPACAQFEGLSRIVLAAMARLGLPVAASRIAVGAKTSGRGRGGGTPLPHPPVDIAHLAGAIAAAMSRPPAKVAAGSAAVPPRASPSPGRMSLAHELKNQGRPADRCGVNPYEEAEPGCGR